MRRFLIVFCFVCLTACDDGDVITVELEFDQELEICENDTESYLIYDLREDPNESLSIIIPKNDDTELFFEESTLGTSEILTINGSSIRFLYRTYNRAVVSAGTNQELCDVIPPSDLSIIESYEATTGTVEISVTIEDDDGDGVPTAFEGRGELDANGEYSNALDTDGDLIPDYLDEDDDNDNVKTINEIDNSDGDNDPTTNPLNTDADLPNGDITPDYLDDDDDGDLIPTIEEDEDGDKNPRNDQNTNSDGILVPHYLNTLEVTMYVNPGLTDDNEYSRTVTTSFIVRDIDLEILRSTLIELGTLTTTIVDYPQED